MGAKPGLSHQDKNTDSGCLRAERGVIFGPKRDGVKGGWAISHNWKLHNFHSPTKIEMMIKSKMT
jgi:hypothetical protein